MDLFGFKKRKKRKETLNSIKYKRKQLNQSNKLSEQGLGGDVDHQKMIKKIQKEIKDLKALYPENKKIQEAKLKSPNDKKYQGHTTYKV